MRNMLHFFISITILLTMTCVSASQDEPRPSSGPVMIMGGCNDQFRWFADSVSAVTGLPIYLKHPYDPIWARNSDFGIDILLWDKIPISELSKEKVEGLTAESSQIMHGSGRIFIDANTVVGVEHGCMNVLDSLRVKGLMFMRDPDNPDKSRTYYFTP